MGTEADDLYGVPREEFVAARTALAKRLAAEGDKSAAAEVKRLRKPSVSAAAVNLAVRRHPEAIERLLAAGTALCQVQEEALAGGDRGQADELREATRNLAAAIDEVTRLAAREDGVSAAQQDRIATTLRAAATDDEAADLLRRGVLVEDLQAAGFGLTGVPAGPRPKTAERSKAEDQAAAEARAEARRELRVAQDEAETAQRRAARQQERADEAERRAQEAAAVAEQARADAQRMAEESGAARQRAEAAARRLDEVTGKV